MISFSFIYTPFSLFSFYQVISIHYLYSLSNFILSFNVLQLVDDSCKKCFSRKPNNKLFCSHCGHSEDPNAIRKREKKYCVYCGKKNLIERDVNSPRKLDLGSPRKELENSIKKEAINNNNNDKDKEQVDIIIENENQKANYKNVEDKNNLQSALSSPRKMNDEEICSCQHGKTSFVFVKHII